MSRRFGTKRRMLKVKLKRFCDAFPLQWLQLDRMISSTPDRVSQFYFSKYRLSMHMMEPLASGAVLLENLPVTSSYTPTLPKIMQLNKAYGELVLNLLSKADRLTRLLFERTRTKDMRSGGVITNAAVMTMLSTPEHSPFLRAWLASVVFNDPQNHS